MRSNLKYKLAAVMVLAAVSGAFGDSPGDHYATDVVPGAPYTRNVTVYGNVKSNDVPVFLDDTGARVGATNLMSMVTFPDETDPDFNAWDKSTGVEITKDQVTDFPGGIWTNPPSATNWTWTSNGREITLSGYSGPNAVVIPDMLDGLPVTGFGDIFEGNTDITSIGGGANIKAVGDYAFGACMALNSVSLPACTTVGDSAFYACENLSSVSLPACTTVGDYAFYACENLSSVSLPACTTVGDYAFYECWTLNSVSLPACTTVGGSAFYGCGALNSVSLPACTTVGVGAFQYCGALNSVTFGQNAPAPAADVFEYSTPTIYVSNPHATGWGDTWNGRPVVRAASMPDIASHNTDGTAHADIRQAIDAIPLPPANVVNGWLVWDSGSNCYWRVSATNLRFYIWSSQ